MKEQPPEPVPEITAEKMSQYRVRILRTRTEARPVCVYRERPSAKPSTQQEES